MTGGCSTTGGRDPPAFELCLDEFSEGFLIAVAEGRGVKLADAALDDRLRMAAVQNKAASYITPTAHSGELALSGRVATVKELDASIADPAAPDAYPITTYSWMFLYPRYADKAKGKAMRDFAEWALSPQSQNYGAQLGYLPLSADVTELGTQALAGLSY